MYAKMPSTIAMQQDAEQVGKQQPDWKRPKMSTVTTRDGTQIYYKDWGAGQPVVFQPRLAAHADAWDEQMSFLPRKRLPRDRP